MILQVERAIDDLLRGYPLIIEDNGKNILVFASETFDEKQGGEILANVKTNAQILLTDKRISYLQQKEAREGFYALDFDFTKIEELISGKPDILEVNHKTDEIFQAAVKLVKIAELLPSVIFVEISQEEKMHLLEKHLILSLKASEIVEYDEHINLKLEEFVEAPLTLANAENAKIIGFRAKNSGKTHYAIIVGEVSDEPLLRIHSSCFTGDLLGSLKCDCGEQLQGAIKYMAENGGGVVIYLMQEGRGIGLSSKLRTYNMQAKGIDTVEANEFLGYQNDERSFLPAQKIMQKLNIKKIRLISNNPRKAAEVEKYGVKVVEIVSLQTKINPHNIDYLKTKVSKSGHKIDIK